MIGISGLLSVRSNAWSSTPQISTSRPRRHPGAASRQPPRKRRHRSHPSVKLIRPTGARPGAGTTSPREPTGPRANRPTGQCCRDEAAHGARRTCSHGRPSPAGYAARRRTAELLGASTWSRPGPPPNPTVFAVACPPLTCQYACRSPGDLPRQPSATRPAQAADHVAGHIRDHRAAGWTVFSSTTAVPGSRPLADRIALCTNPAVAGGPPEYSTLIPGGTCRCASPTQGALRRPPAAPRPHGSRSPRLGALPTRDDDSRSHLTLRATARGSRPRCSTTSTVDRNFHAHTQPPPRHVFPRPDRPASPRRAVHVQLRLAALDRQMSRANLRHISLTVMTVSASMPSSPLSFGVRHPRHVGPASRGGGGVRQLQSPRPPLMVWPHSGTATSSRWK
jgi:hypothetical protein